jgi:DNA polymerase-3 subunit beta
MKNKTIKIETLLKALKFLKQVISNRPILPILENVLFIDGKIIATDLQNFIEYNIGVNWGSFTLPANELTKLLSNLPKSSEISFINNPETYQTEILIIGTNKKFKLKGESHEDFPVVPKTEKSIGLLTQVDIIKIKSVLPYVCTDDYKPAMGGVYLNGEIASTDGHRLIWFKSDNKLKKSFILPSRAAKIINEEIHSVYYGKKDETEYINLKTEDYSLITRAIDESYPDYKTVIPQKNPIKAEINRKAFIESLKLALLAANKTTHRIILEINSDLKISSNDLDFETEFSDNIQVNVKGKKGLFEIGFNGKFLLEFAEDIQEEKIIFEFSEPHKAAIINGNRLLMPVMLN